MTVEDRTIKIAVIGGGIVGTRHAKLISQHPNVELSGLVEPSPTGIRVAAGLHTKHYFSLAELFESGIPDAAIVASPTQVTDSIARKLIAQGVHMLVENTLSTKVKSAEEIANVADKKGVSLLMGHHRRFHPSIVAAKKAIDSGELGIITAISGSWTLRKPMDYLDSVFPSEDWENDKRLSRQLYLNLVHDIDILQYLIGPIVRVYAQKFPSINAFGAQSGSAQQASVTLLFNCGAIGTFMLSDFDSSRDSSTFGSSHLAAHSPQLPSTEEASSAYYIFGTTASLSIPEMARYSFEDSGIGWTSKMKVDTLLVESGLSYDLQLDHFINVLRGQEKPNCSGKESVMTLKVATAVQESLKDGDPIDIE
ncbi:hypothetical protein AWJ20_1146 [Sugiyamaella lignohabitans]|uniref:Gfo/Idh/MocA-like oxidoreductase N-terminal domain-containing protein n=1 Tax=Sugiyamaella lignohabitans TaxID=796027 RepID=A0A161HLE4_9ASCO|nr:uncharacterized protein AWJ20_1146 [Sugiyamaella lignohabitans]ANB12868.1 hypothetical protein AWJ20_1146 [Sugiyamaella lignohabitans]